MGVGQQKHKEKDGKQTLMMAICEVNKWGRVRELRVYLSEEGTLEVRLMRDLHHFLWDRLLVQSEAGNSEVVRPPTLTQGLQMLKERVGGIADGRSAQSVVQGPAPGSPSWLPGTPLTPNPRRSLGSAFLLVPRYIGFPWPL